MLFAVERSILDPEHTTAVCSSTRLAEASRKFKDTNFTLTGPRVVDEMKNNDYNKNNIGHPNPYSPQHPASPEYFADRADILDYFRKTVLGFTTLRTVKPINFAVLGEWGVGKTSILHKFQQIISEELPGKIVCFSSLFTLTPEYCESLSNFFAVFLAQLKEEFRTSTGMKGKIRTELDKWKVSFKIPAVGVELTRERSVSYFSKDLESLWHKHLKPAGVHVAILFLDDIHHFIPRQPGAFETLRNIFQSLAMKGCKYSLVISGPRLLFTYASDIAEPFTRFFQPFYVDNFSVSDTREAIMRPLEVNNITLKITEDLIARIHERTFGHPYFVIYAMYALLNYLTGVGALTAREFESVWPKISSALEITKFKPDFDSASESERKVLQSIASIGEDKVTPSMVRGVTGSTVLFRRLEQKGLLIKSERGRYQLYHPLFKEYLKRLGN